MALWGVEWRSRNRRDGETRHLCRDTSGLPVLFVDRRRAREWAERTYGYIRRRRDLRAEPHGWRMPVAVRVRVEKEATAGKLLFRGTAMVHTDGVRLLATAGYSTPRSAPASPRRRIEILETRAKP